MGLWVGEVLGGVGRGGGGRPRGVLRVAPRLRERQKLAATRRASRGRWQNMLCMAINGHELQLMAISND